MTGIAAVLISFTLYVLAIGASAGGSIGVLIRV